MRITKRIKDFRPPDRKGTYDIPKECLLFDYHPDNSPDGDEGVAQTLKEIIYSNRLTKVEREMIVLYTHYRNAVKVAKELGLSVIETRKKIKNTIHKIKNEYNRHSSHPERGDNS